MAGRLSRSGGPTTPSSGAPGCSWARAADSLDEARRALAHLPAERFSQTEALALRAWFAAREGRADQERTALEQLIEQVPAIRRRWNAWRCWRPSRAKPPVRPSCTAARPTSIGPRSGTCPLARTRQGHHAVCRAGRSGRETRARLRGARLVVSGIATPAQRARNRRGRAAGPPLPDPHLPAGRTLAFHLARCAGLPVNEPLHHTSASRPCCVRPAVAEVGPADHLARVPRRRRVRGPAVRLR